MRDMTFFRDFQDPKATRDIGIARPIHLKTCLRHQLWSGECGGCQEVLGEMRGSAGSGDMGKCGERYGKVSWGVRRDV